MPHAGFGTVCREILRVGLPVRFRANGASMAPAIRDGDLLIVAPIAGQEIRRGEVVLFESERGPTAHRVIERASASLRTRGDAPGSQEEHVTLDQVLGRVQEVSRQGRTIAAWGPIPRALMSCVDRIERRARVARAQVRRVTRMFSSHGGSGLPD
jgi:hypothetical protein